MKKAIIILFVVAIFLIFLGTCDFGDNKANNTKTSSKEQSSTRLAYEIGETVILPYTFLGTTKQNHNQLIDYSVAKYSEGIEDMLMAGQAFIVAENTKATVIGSSFLTLQVKILDGKYEGEIGWISAETVNPE